MEKTSFKTRMVNRFLYWYYRKPIATLCLYMKTVKGIRGTDIHMLESIYLHFQMTYGIRKAYKIMNRIIFLCMYFGLIEKAKSPFFKRDICYRLKNDIKAIL